jgi:hypothetical protein
VSTDRTDVDQTFYVQDSFNCPAGALIDLSRKQAVTESSPRRSQFRDLLLNSFKHILHHSITPHSMKIECFFPFHSRTRIECRFR